MTCCLKIGVKFFVCYLHRNSLREEALQFATEELYFLVFGNANVVNWNVLAEEMFYYYIII